MTLSQPFKIATQGMVAIFLLEWFLLFKAINNACNTAFCNTLRLRYAYKVFKKIFLSSDFKHYAFLFLVLLFVKNH